MAKEICEHLKALYEFLRAHPEIRIYGEGVYFENAACLKCDADDYWPEIHKVWDEASKAKKQ
jgi:hypothetical protein